MGRRDWNRDEQLLALRLYCLLPFGKLHQSNPDVVAIARKINRSSSAVAMKACNFASLDPALDQRGLGNVSRADRVLWDEFQNDSESIAAEAEAVYASMEENSPVMTQDREFVAPTGETESERTVRVRRVQGFFRKAVLVGYDYQCALTGLRIPQLLIASHIIPWGADEKRRADPTNGIVLNALYDRAFDQGFISFDDEFRVLISNQLETEIASSNAIQELFNIEGVTLKMPVRFRPDVNAIRYHRANIYKT